MALEPITRKEKIIAGQDLTPITRMEKFLKQYGGGGGGGGSADAVLYTKQTLTEAQKKQARENVGAASDFVVNGTLNRDMTVTLDKTFEQIKEAINVGKTPIVLMNNRNYLPIVSVDTDYIVFSSSSGDDKEISFFTLYVYPSQNPQFNYVFSVVLNPDKTMPQVSMASDPTEAMQIATKKYVDDNVCILHSTTPGSTKKFKITVDDSGAISATEV